MLTLQERTSQQLQTLLNKTVKKYKSRPPQRARVALSAQIERITQELKKRLDFNNSI